MIQMKKLGNFLKKETVLCVAVMLACISAFLVTPDGEYFGYIDFRTLAILFCLMCVMAGLQKLGVFGQVAEDLLRRVHGLRQIQLVLVLLCFFFSMFITNDVALITFVPLTFTVLEKMGEEWKRKLAVPIVVMQTMAANLGSMLTPIGNPQNLYLYSKSGLPLQAFLLRMLPYSGLSFLLLAGWCIRYRPKSDGPTSLFFAFRKKEEQAGSKVQLVVYGLLFMLCLATVARMVWFPVAFGITLIVLLLMDWDVFRRVDYSLLITFMGFFIFIGNMGRITIFRTFLERVVGGHEVLSAVLSSQLISNVPAALLLSEFTTDYGKLLVGVNLGGLGTLIASMASLISYKQIVKEIPEEKGAYFRRFTWTGILFLVILLAMCYVLLYNK